MKKGRSQRRQKHRYLRQSSSSTNISRPSEAPRPCRKSRVACKRGHSQRSVAAFSGGSLFQAPTSAFSNASSGRKCHRVRWQTRMAERSGARAHDVGSGKRRARIDADLYLPAHLKTLYQEFRVNAGTRLMVMKRTWLWGKPRPAAAAFIPDKESACCCANPVRRNASRPQPNSDRLCGLSRCGWSEDAVSLDAGASREPIHHTDRAVQQNVPVDDAKFAPAPASAPGKP